MFKMANAPKTKVYLLKHSGDFDAKPAAFEQVSFILYLNLLQQLVLSGSIKADTGRPSSGTL